MKSKSCVLLVRGKKQREKKAKKIQRQKEYDETQKEMKRNRRLMKQDRKAASALTTEEAAHKTNGPPVRDPGPQKTDTPKPEKKEACRVKAKKKVQDEPGDGIPLLVPIGKTPAKENVEMQKHTTGKKSPKKSPGLHTPCGKEAFPLWTPRKQQSSGSQVKCPGKKPGVKQEVEKEINSPLGKKDPRQMSQSQRPSSLLQLMKLQNKAPHTLKQRPPNPKVSQLT